MIDVNHRAGEVDAAFRPNQIFAIGGLPIQLLDGERASQVVALVEEQLLTRITSRIMPAASGSATAHIIRAPSGQLDAHWGHELKMRKLLSIRRCILRFMESPVFLSDLLMAHEPGWERPRLAGELMFPVESDTPAGRWRSQEVHRKARPGSTRGLIREFLSGIVPPVHLPRMSFVRPV